MESQYGIAVKNKYELFLSDEDADPLEILRLQEEENQKKKDEVGKTGKKDAKKDKAAKSAKIKQNKKALVTVVDQQPKTTDQNANRRDDKPPRAKSRQEGDKRDRENRPARDGQPRERRNDRSDFKGDRQTSDFKGERQTSDFNRERGDRPDGGRGRGRGRGGRGRGGEGRGRGGYDRFGKRDFDRHSGSDKTGIKPVEKREGGGAHNWGNVKDDLEDAMNTTNTSEENPEWTEKKVDPENPESNEQEPGTEVNEEAEPEEKQMTLEEYKAQKEKERVKASFNIRRAGEGCEDSEWKKMHVLKKKPAANSDEEDSDDEYEDYEDERRGRHSQKTVPIQITFNDAPGRGGGRGRGGRGERRGGGGERGGRGGGERGERGGRGGGERGRGGRGGRGGFGDRGGRGGFGDRGGHRGGGRKEAAPHFDDENDFPALVKAEAS